MAQYTAVAKVLPPGQRAADVTIDYSMAVAADLQTSPSVAKDEVYVSEGV